MKIIGINTLNKKTKMTHKLISTTTRQILTGSLVAIAMAGCGGGETNADNHQNSRGILQQNPPKSMSSMSANEINTSSSWQLALSLAGQAKCGVDVRYIQYSTVDAKDKQTNATGALMVPTGNDPACSGARPIVIYAHGTSFSKNHNIADISNKDNDGYFDGIMSAAIFAAQGFIVVAPNYAGYDTSSLSYHPYLNADQQSKDVIDALSAARSALPAIGKKDSGKLFITGHSQGGFVAMATQRALQAAGQEVTAVSPSSGPYAMSAFGDDIFYGKVNMLASSFTTLLVSSYQQAYGNIFSNPADIFTSKYANTAYGFFPSTKTDDEIISQSLIPTALFSTTPPTAPIGSASSLQNILNAATIPPTIPANLAPVYAQGFGEDSLINNSFRAKYIMDAVANPDGLLPTITTGLPPAKPANPLRQALKVNDLRNWTPKQATLLCGGNADPMVYFDSNTLAISRYWTAPSPTAAAPGILTVLDVDSAITGNKDQYADAKTIFSSLKEQVISQAVASGATDGGASAVSDNYHATFVWAACTIAARNFFLRTLAAGQ